MSRHLIANSLHESRDVVTIVGWDPDMSTYFCDIEYADGVRVPFAGGEAREIPKADWLASILAEAGIDIPAVLVARLRLELLALSTADAPQLDWRSGEPTPIT